MPKLINNSKIKDTENILINGTVQNNTQNFVPRFGIKGSDNLVLQSDAFKHDNNSDEIQKLKDKLNTVKNQQGLIGKTWNGIKKIFGGGSKKVENAILKCERGEITVSEAQSVLNKFEKGQKTCVDVVADMISAIISIFVYNTAIPKEKASIVIGLTASTITGAGVKTGIKAADAAVGKREYTKKDLLIDSATGAMNGIMGPVSNALGAKATEKLGNKFGLEVISDGVKNADKTGIKSKIQNILSTQSVDVKGGTLAKRAVALGAGMAIDGALSGASDNMVRASIEGDNVIEAGVQGAIGGGIAAPVIGGGFRVAAKAGKSLNNAIITKQVLKNGAGTTFRQGKTGDCSLLTIIDGIMNNQNAQKKVKNAITKSAAGDYFVKIGDRTVQVAKDSITDEMLSDVTGIRIFEQAYKQIAGDLDGGFADVVAKQFGFCPVHITSDLITDEMLDTISKEQKNTILALGFNVDDFGQISEKGANKHYFNIREIDTKAKTVKVTNPYDTSRVIELPYDTVKKSAVSIDGGTIKETALPNSFREAGEVSFKGVDFDSKIKAFSEYFKSQDFSLDEFERILSDPMVSAKKYSVRDFISLLELNNVSLDEVSEFVEHISGAQSFGELFSEFGEEETEKTISQLLKVLENKHIVSRIDILEPYHLSLSELDDFISASNNFDIPKICKILKNSDSKVFDELGGEQYIKNNIPLLSNLEISPEFTVSPEHLIEFPTSGNKKRFFIFKNATTIPHKQHKIDWRCLIKSNMITEDAVNIAQKYGLQFPDVCTANIKGNNGTVEYVTSELIEKAQKYGYDKLSSFEIHALTDMLDNVFKNNSKLLSSNKQLSQMGNRIYDVVDYLKMQSQTVLEGTNVEFGDHVFLRMMDRNMANVVDNSTGNLIEFPEFIKLISDEAKKNVKNAVKNGDYEFPISGLDGSKNIKVKIIVNGNKIIVDSIF